MDITVEIRARNGGWTGLVHHSDGRPTRILDDLRLGPAEKGPREKRRGSRLKLISAKVKNLFEPGPFSWPLFTRGLGRRPGAVSAVGRMPAGRSAMPPPNMDAAIEHGGTACGVPPYAILRTLLVFAAWSA